MELTINTDTSSKELVTIAFDFHLMWVKLNPQTDPSKKANFGRHDCGMDPGADVHLSQQILHMHLDRGFRYPEITPNFLVAGTACNALEMDGSGAGDSTVVIRPPR